MAGGKLNMVVFMAMVVAVLLQSSGAQATEHVVGEELGWIVPPGGAIVYSTWASNQTFIVGDVLVFNFANGSHDVAEVTKTAYESCNTSNTTSLATTSPARITLSTAGEHFFLCTFPRHCSLGQLLAINVTATAPTPSSTPTASPPSPTASPPSPTASPPSPTASPPSPTASPPSPTASPPSPTASPPSPTASPPSPTPSSPSPTSSPPSPPTSATPPSPSTSPPAPTTPSPAGSTPPPPPDSSAPSFAVAALPVTIMSIVVALLY